MDSSTKQEPGTLPNTSTSLSDDPMCQDFEMEGFKGLKANKGVPPCCFAVTTEGLQGLIDHTYETIAAVVDGFPNFKDRVSLSMFSYYIWQHTYARLASISLHNTGAYSEEYQFISYFLNQSEYVVPSVIGDYLSSIGNIVDQAGNKFKLVFPVWPNKEGHYGRVSADTHYMYESLAAPVVIAQRIVEDLAYTLNPKRSHIWNLPADLRPDEDKAGLPTPNLLGWAPATTLTDQQLSALQFDKIKIDHFYCEVPMFQFNWSLCQSICGIIRLAEAKIKFVSSSDQSPNGSIAQTQWQYVTSYMSNLGGKQYTEAESVHQLNNYMEDIRITVGALICAFRVRKEGKNYSCYDFQSYSQVPDAWYATRNTIFNYGQGERWNSYTFKSAPVNKYPLRTAWIRKMLKTHKEDEKKPESP